MIFAGTGLISRAGKSMLNAIPENNGFARLKSEKQKGSIMMKFKRMAAVLTASVLAVVLAGCCCKSSCREVGRKLPPVRESKTAYASDALKPFVDSGELPGAISVLYNKGLQETACVGWADVDKKIPMSMDRTFMQCSQTKGFCGVTVAILVEEGKLSLDDPVSKYLPEFKELKIAVKG